MNALGLHRNRERGHTHVFFQELYYVPGVPRDFKSRVQVKQYGVFKLADVLWDMDKIGFMGRPAREVVRLAKEQQAASARKSGVSNVIPVSHFHIRLPKAELEMR